MQWTAVSALCILPVMRTHADIIKDAGPAKVSDHLGDVVTLPAVNSWIARGSIPAVHWDALASGGFTTLEELAKAAARSAKDDDRRRRAVKLSAGASAAA